MRKQPKPALEFPQRFQIKVVGHSGDAFEAAVVPIIRKHVPDLAEGAITLRPSKQGKYTALTATITAQSREQLDALYRELTACEHVLLAL